MLALAAPAVGSILERLSRRFMARMEKSAALAEKCFLATNEAAQQKGWMLGPLSDAGEDVTARAERRITLKFPVLDARTGQLLSQNGRCHIILVSGTKVRGRCSIIATKS